MNHTNLTTDGGILEGELETAAEQGGIKDVRVVETTDGFYVVATVETKTETRFLATRRKPNEPRVFKDLERLNNLLRSVYPTGSIDLQCEGKYSPKSPSKKIPATKKTRAKKALSKKPKAVKKRKAKN